MKINSIFNKYKSFSPMIKASFWGVVCAVLQKGISFITVPIFTRLMSSTEYGSVNLFLSWESIISIFATLNLSSGVYNVGLSKFENDTDKFTSSLSSLSLISTFFVFIILLSVSSFLLKYTNISLKLLYLMFFYILFTPAVNFWSQKERFFFRYKKLLVITLLMSLLNPLLGIFLLKIINFENKGIIRIVSIVIINLIFGLIFFVIIQKRKPCLYNGKYWKYALKFNIPLIPHYLSMVVLNSSDRIMIDKFCGLDETAYYSVAWSLSYVISIITSSILLSFNPYSFRKFKIKEYEKVENISNILFICVVVICLMFIAIAPEILSFVAPSNYNSAVWVIPPLVSCILFTFLYSLFANVEFFYENNMYVMMASIFGALLNIFLNYIFIPKFGFIAAGYTSMFCYICFCLAHFVFSKIVMKQQKIERIYNVKILFIVTVAYLGIALLMTLFYKIFLLRYLIFVALLFFIFIFRKNIFSNFNEILRKE